MATKGVAFTPNDPAKQIIPTANLTLTDNTDPPACCYRIVSLRAPGASANGPRGQPVMGLKATADPWRREHRHEMDLTQYASGTPERGRKTQYYPGNRN
jgi:hypothetical protein